MSEINIVKLVEDELTPINEDVQLNKSICSINDAGEAFYNVDLKISDDVFSGTKINDQSSINHYENIDDLESISIEGSLFNSKFNNSADYYEVINTPEIISIEGPSEDIEANVNLTRFQLIYKELVENILKFCELISYFLCGLLLLFEFLKMFFLNPRHY